MHVDCAQRIRSSRCTYDTRVKCQVGGGVSNSGKNIRFLLLITGKKNFILSMNRGGLNLHFDCAQRIRSSRCILE